jgi:hypothetical protein
MASENTLYEIGIFTVHLTVYEPGEKHERFREFGDRYQEYSINYTRYELYAAVRVLRSESKFKIWRVSTEPTCTKRESKGFLMGSKKIVKTRRERLEDAIHEAIKKANRSHEQWVRRKEEANGVAKKSQGYIEGIEEAKKITG